jgi:hypothetical protein
LRFLYPKAKIVIIFWIAFFIYKKITYEYFTFVYHSIVSEMSSLSKQSGGLIAWKRMPFNITLYCVPGSIFRLSTTIWVILFWFRLCFCIFKLQNIHFHFLFNWSCLIVLYLILKVHFHLSIIQKSKGFFKYINQFNIFFIHIPSNKFQNTNYLIEKLCITHIKLIII